MQHPLAAYSCSKGVFCLSEYQVTLSSVPVGIVNITEEGLYLRFRCRCTVSEDQIYRLYAYCDNQRYDLGVLIPDGGFFIVDKKFPKKIFTSNDFRFLILSRTENVINSFEMIDPEQPCRCLQHLPKARLRIDGGKYYIVL